MDILESKEKQFIDNFAEIYFTDERLRYIKLFPIEWTSRGKIQKLLKVKLAVLYHHIGEKKLKRNLGDKMNFKDLGIIQVKEVNFITFYRLSPIGVYFQNKFK